MFQVVNETDQTLILERRDNNLYWQIYGKIHPGMNQFSDTDSPVRIKGHGSYNHISPGDTIHIRSVTSKTPSTRATGSGDDDDDDTPTPFYKQIWFYAAIVGALLIIIAFISSRVRK